MSLYIRHSVAESRWYLSFRPPPAGRRERWWRYPLDRVAFVGQDEGNDDTRAWLAYQWGTVDPVQKPGEQPELMWAFLGSFARVRMRINDVVRLRHGFTDNTELGYEIAELHPDPLCMKPFCCTRCVSCEGRGWALRWRSTDKKDTIKDVCPICLGVGFIETTEGNPHAKRSRPETLTCAKTQELMDDYDRELGLH